MGIAVVVLSVLGRAGCKYGGSYVMCRAGECVDSFVER